MQNSELDSKFLTSEANYAQVNKKLGMAQAGFQTVTRQQCIVH